MAALSGAEGPLGEAIYAQSRQTYARPIHGEARSPLQMADQPLWFPDESRSPHLTL
jgi:hypothetical protein